MFHSPRVSAVASIAPSHPPSVMLRPASRAASGRTASASRRLRWVQPAHRPAAPLDAPLLTKSCDSDAPGRGLCRPGPKARGQAQTNRVTRMTRMRPVAARAGPGQCPRAGPGDSDASERAGEATDKEITSRTKMYLANRRCEGVPDAGRDRVWRRQGSAPSARQAQSRDGRRRPGAARGPALDTSGVNFECGRGCA